MPFVIEVILNPAANPNAGVYLNRAAQNYFAATQVGAEVFATRIEAMGAWSEAHAVEIFNRGANKPAINIVYIV